MVDVIDAFLPFGECSFLENHIGIFVLDFSDAILAIRGSEKGIGN